jgi:hypothetical protein
MGLGLYTTGSVLFFTRLLGLSAASVGVGLTLAAVVGLSASVPAGRLADRRTGRAVLIPLYAAQAALFAVFPLVGNRIEFFAVVCGVALAESGARPVRRALLSEMVTGAERVAAAAYNRAVLNVGVAVGAAGAGLALGIGSRLAYDSLVLGNAISFAVAALLLVRLKLPSRMRGDPDHKALRRDAGPFRNFRFLLTALLCGLLYMSASILVVAIPLQISQHSGAPTWLMSPLLMLNTGLVIALQVRISHGSETVVGAARANRRAGLALLAACALIPASSMLDVAGGVVVLLAATVLLTVGELLASAGSWGLSYELSPQDRHAEWLGVFGLFSSAAQMPGPALAALAVSSGTLAFIVLGLGFLAAGLLSEIVAKGAAQAQVA